MELEQIAKALQKGTLSVEKAVYLELPETMLHLFACDCAERSLIREQNVARKIDSRCWDALKIKRRWVHQDASNDERQEALRAVQEVSRNAWERVEYAKRRAALNTAFRAIWVLEKASWAAAEGVVKSTVQDAQRAALYAAQCALETALRSDFQPKDVTHLTTAEEQRWQQRRLAWFLSLHLFAGERWQMLAPGGPTPASAPADAQLHDKLPSSPHPLTNHNPTRVKVQIVGQSAR